MTTTKDIEKILKEKGDKISGITFERGSGNEYFDVKEIKADKNGKFTVVLDTGEEVDSEFLNSLNGLIFHLKEDIVVKEPKYSLVLTMSELQEAIRVILDSYDRLVELRSNPSCIADVKALPDKLWHVKSLLKKAVLMEDISEFEIDDEEFFPL